MTEGCTKVSGLGRQAGGFAVSIMLGFCLPFYAAAVQLPMSLLPVNTPWALPLSPPLAGLDDWRLHGLFYKSGGGGWALLSTDKASALHAESGAMLQDGIQLEAIANDGVWLVRGQYRTFLRLTSLPPSVVTHDYTISLNPEAEVPSDACQMYISGGVPIDELRTLGLCPSEG